MKVLETIEDIKRLQETVEKASLTREERHKLLAPLQSLVSAVNRLRRKHGKLSWV